MVFMDKKMYMVYMWNLWMQRLIHSQLQATFLHCIQSVIMSYKTDQRDASVNGNKWNSCFKVILEARIWKNFCFLSSPTSGIRSWVTTTRKSGQWIYIQLIGRLKILWLNMYTDTYKHLHSHKLKSLKFNAKGVLCKKKKKPIYQVTFVNYWKRKIIVQIIH